MKKKQNLGKALTKTEQKEILGGKRLGQQATCHCDDGYTYLTCGSNCAQAKDHCVDFSAYCDGHGGFLLATGCVEC